MERCLIIVSRDRPDLWQELNQNYAQAEGVDIILDRRGWRRWTFPPDDTDRRSPSSIGSDFPAEGFVVVPRP